MPGRVFRTNLAVPMSAPVLPALTQACARPSFTRSIATRIEECFLVRMAVRTSSSMPTTCGGGDDGDARVVARRMVRARARARAAPSSPTSSSSRLGMRGEEVEAGGDGDRRAVVPAHRVDGDDGLHCSACNEPGRGRSVLRSG